MRTSDNNSSNEGGHKRSAGAGVSFQMAMDDGPISTTKAMMVSIVVPRFVTTSKADDSDHEDEDTDANADDDNNDAKTVATTATNEDETPTENTNMASAGASTETKKNDEPKEKGVEEKSSIVQTLSSSAKEAKETEEKEEEEEEPTPEEAAHVVVSNDDPDETEVNVEALLRLTLKTLLVEWHLLTVPTFTTTNQQLAQQLDPSNHRDRPPDAWVQVQFMARPTSLAVVLDRLERIGVGTNCGSVTVYRAELCRTTSAYAQAPIEEDDILPVSANDQHQANGDPSIHSSAVANASGRSKSGKLTPTAAESDEAEAKMTERMIEAAKMEWKNAATRLRIEQVREQISEQAALTFDFIALCAIASILAGVGLITDNTVVIVASMLVSPIMGPVLGLTFGSRIKDWPLVVSSFQNEVFALLGCVFIGVLVGLGAAFTDVATTWPTNEMQIRGEATGLITGIAIAIPSGMGVCLSVLGGNTSSLVGVAISASLLPPAVNAGICFVYSFFLAIGAVENDEGNNAGDFAYIGAISFALTALNIVCIWISGLIMFEIKEVTPQKKKSAFWAKDIKVARELNKGTEKPPPVDISLIKKGIGAALNKEQQNAEPGERIVFGPHLMYGPHAAPKQLSSKHLGTTAFPPLSPQQQSRKRTEGGAGMAGLFSSLFSGFNGGDVPVGIKEEEVDENVRYVGLEDMGGLLGFDAEDDDWNGIDYAQVAQHIGTGRYI